MSQVSKEQELQDLLEGVDEFFNFSDTSVGIYSVDTITSYTKEDFEDAMGVNVLEYSKDSLTFQTDDAVYTVRFSPEAEKWLLYTLIKTAPIENNTITNSLQDFKDAELVQIFLSLLKNDSIPLSVKCEYLKKLEKLDSAYAKLWDTIAINQVNEHFKTRALLDKLLVSLETGKKGKKNE